MIRSSKLIILYLIFILFFYTYLFLFEIVNFHNIYKKIYFPALIKNNSFDFFVLSITYPTTYCLNHLDCNGEKLNYINKNFNIHGLWANNYDGSYPSYCSSIPFDSKYIEENKDTFKKYWGTFNNNLEYDFYKHEWEKHGTCSNSSKIYDNESYFSNIITLIKDYDILECLNRKNIYPSNMRTYTNNEIRNSLYECYPYSFNIICEKNKNRNYLKEIHFYYSKDLEHIKFNYGDTCNNDIIIPKID
jgi:ribonuclease T2